MWDGIPEFIIINFKKIPAQEQIIYDSYNGSEIKTPVGASAYRAKYILKNLTTSLWETRMLCYD